MHIEKKVRFFHLYLETYGLYYFLNRFVIFNKYVLVPLDHFYQEQFDSPDLPSLFYYST